ncbi:hypothetical protein LIER_14088 [Lithospermum erythrorhizon]|uniref:Serine-rich protein-like protein n=1 Tax=Lithospermum erythrorhizon TaxID=34254 RepID=A0AAV3Q330_LITER
MEANSRRSNNGQTFRSLSPPGKFYSTKYRTTLLSRSISPTHVSVSAKSVASSTSNKSILERKTTSYSSTSPTSMSVFNKFAASSDRFNSNRPTLVSDNQKPAGPSQTKSTCLCSPTNHPGSFRCSLHKKIEKTMSFVSNKLERSAMANSLVKLGAIEGDLVKRALAALIRPSSHQLRRRNNFQSRPSRLSVMSKVLRTF